ncbi:hypothetical protein [Microbacterium sp.]|nr:hypothetical protein [Microbacterium sp.]MBN9223804.1 hypothetical protein [Microbacterium sp.]
MTSDSWAVGAVVHLQSASTFGSQSIKHIQVPAKREKINRACGQLSR